MVETIMIFGETEIPVVRSSDIDVEHYLEIWLAK